MKNYENNPEPGHNQKGKEKKKEERRVLRSIKKRKGKGMKLKEYSEHRELK